MDDQAFLTNELSRAAESLDHQGELQLFIVHYHQAVFAAIQGLQLCPHCATLDLTRLKTNASVLQQSDFTSVKELMQTCKKGLRDLILLCPRCNTAFQRQILVLFFEIRQHR
jgi:hypothetical protein